MAALIALIVFVLAAFGVAIGSVNLIAVGLAFLTLHFIIGGWPFGVLRFPTVTDRRN